ncbi:tRNA uridine-5-carboxymethylaminomethyl(34) synthesis GTPase MnmE [Chlorobium sp. N1]|uniref:tRNA uridine-5-carboxymethylaminomethyl(34) synthesis GTPase MnmE n=1 Tax=Chlorobium sp. N1 TaxID=2491138 RepID=UPI00103B3F84|nr:tRNA uridine-5-carboxymethylaminomethyl(34) synthesis GTPase MnmE [Chlorobium sp. N1]TCD48093.1 tRNA uridine-5-carboxymethylaminomethyl(34) synthesis GTPase MnmE [Chlorobium sp. N1]
MTKQTVRQEEPIAAIATPVGVGALAIVRMSGRGVFAVADRVFRRRGGGAFSFAEAEGFTAHFGTLSDKGGMVDEVIALVFRAPSSFTTEDMVEFTCHGGPVVVRQVLQALLDGGCRLAEPGEFTRRAFLNGRIDLLQAEAIGEMIHARTEAACRTAATQMQGALSLRLQEMREGLLHSCALLELELDFSEEDVEFQSREDLEASVLRLEAEISRLVESYREGHMVAEGVSTVIAGRPNAGKSTLLNRLLGEERAIVSHMPGTTRDYIEECFVHEKTMFRLTDTAGLRESGEEIEHEGIRRSYRKISEADLILYMLDVSGEDAPDEARAAGRLRREHPEARMILVANKTDLAPDGSLRVAELEELSGCPVAGMAARSGEGVEELKGLMASMVEGLDKLQEASVLVTSLRHYEALRNAADSLCNARQLIEAGEATELIAFELRSALDYVGEITGKVVSEELLNTIFSRFCIGK